MGAVPGNPLTERMSDMDREMVQKEITEKVQALLTDTSLAAIAHAARKVEDLELMEEAERRVVELVEDFLERREDPALVVTVISTAFFYVMDAYIPVFLTERAILAILEGLQN